MSAEVEHWGWDIGGAHLKVARVDAAGRLVDVTLQACPLWKGLAHLDRAAAALPPLPRSGSHAVTMTGELVDLFEDREAGVGALVEWVERILQPAPVRVFATPGRWLSPSEAANRPAEVASANWLATVLCAAQRVRDGIVIDIGSTTTDVLAIVDGCPFDPVEGDGARLGAGQLLYTGVVRTPVMVLADRAPYAGHWQPLAAEYFATTADVYRVAGLLPAGADCGETADGGPPTAEGSARRLMRMLGIDYDAANHDAAVRLAEYFGDRQLDRIGLALDQVCSAVPRSAGATRLVGAGVGRFLVERLAVRAGCDYVDFGTLVEAPGRLRSIAADCAPAVALATLTARDGLDVVV